MRNNDIIKLLNNYYLNLSDKNEANKAMNFLKKPWRNKLITRIMKKHWDSIEGDPES
jgi:hypothetical protein